MGSISYMCTTHQTKNKQETTVKHTHAPVIHICVLTRFNRLYIINRTKRSIMWIWKRMVVIGWLLLVIWYLLWNIILPTHRRNVFFDWISALHVRICSRWLTFFKINIFHSCFYTVTLSVHIYIYIYRWRHYTLDNYICMTFRKYQPLNNACQHFMIIWRLVHNLQWF